MEIDTTTKTIWRLSTVLLVIIAFVGAGFFIYGTNRYAQELEASEDLRTELLMLRGVQAKLEKSVAHLDLLPPLAEPDWEKIVTDQINASATRASVRITLLAYDTVEVKEPGLSSLTFTLEVEGNDAAQARCLVFLEETVAGMRFETIEGMLGGGDPYYLRLMVDHGEVFSDSMKVTGRVYCAIRGAS